MAQPKYGLSLGEPRDEEEEFICTPKGYPAQLKSSTVCKHTKTSSGDTVWQLSFSGGVGGQIALAKPDKLRKNDHVALDIAMIASQAAEQGAVAVFIQMSDEGMPSAEALKIDDIGCLLSKPNLFDEQIDIAVAKLTIPVGIIRADVGKKLDTTLKAGVGAVHMFVKAVRVPDDRRTYMKGSRILGEPREPPQPTQPTQPPPADSWSLKAAWRAAMQGATQVAAYVRGRSLLSASLEKALKADPWGLAGAEKILRASEDDIQRDVSETCKVLAQDTSRAFPVRLLILDQLEKSEPVTDAIEAVLRKHVCSGSWIEFKDEIIDRMSMNTLLSRFEAFLNDLVAPASVRVICVDIAGLVQVAELCRCCMQVSGRDGPDFRLLWRNLIQQLSKREQSMRCLLELGRAINELPFQMDQSCVDREERIFVVQMFRSVIHGPSSWWDALTLGIDNTESRFYHVPSPVLRNESVQGVLKDAILQQVKVDVPDAIRQVCILLGKLSRMREVHDEGFETTAHTVIKGLIGLPADGGSEVLRRTRGLCEKMMAVLGDDWPFRQQFIGLLTQDVKKLVKLRHVSPAALSTWCARASTTEADVPFLNASFLCVQVAV